jgi:hypothetical protein
VGLSRLENGGRARNGLLRRWHCCPWSWAWIIAWLPPPSTHRGFKTWGGSAGGRLVALLGTADGTAGFDEVGGFQGTSKTCRR